jgi:hypothetical protein
MNNDALSITCRVDVTDGNGRDRQVVAPEVFSSLSQGVRVR